METVLIDGVGQLADYKLLGTFLIISLSSLFLAVRYIMNFIKKRDDELNARESACESRVEKISAKLDAYIDNDRKVMFRSIQEQTIAYKEFSTALNKIAEKLQA